MSILFGEFLFITTKMRFLNVLNVSIKGAGIMFGGIKLHQMLSVISVNIVLIVLGQFEVIFMLLSLFGNQLLSHETLWHMII